MTKDEALKMAIEALENYEYEKRSEIMQACKMALEQPAQEPVAWISESTLKHSAEYRNRFDDAKSWAEIRAVDRKTTNCDVPLYTYPAPSWQPNKEFVLLSDDELDEIVDRLNVSLILDCSIADFVNAIEAKLKEKNI